MHAELVTDSSVQDLVRFVLGGGAAGILTMFGRALWKARTGRMQKERAENTSIVNQRIAAIEQRDEADDKRRHAMDEVNRLRGILLRNGIDPGAELEYEQTITRKPKKTSRGPAAEKE